MIAKFNLKAMKNLKTLFVELLILTKVMNAKKSNSQLVYAYQQRVESLNFAAVISRSDIVFVTFKLA
jgi:actin-related protein